jgi:hypothetical protein
LGAYLQNDVVNISFSGSITQTYVAVGNPPNPSTPPPNSDWSQLFSAGSPAFSSTTVTSSIYAEASYISAGSDGQFAPLGIAAYPGTAVYTLQEAISQDLASGHGIGFLQTSMYARWIGDVTLVLPGVNQGTQLDWLGTNVVLSIQSVGSITFTETIPSLTVTGTVPTKITSGGTLPGYNTTGSTTQQITTITGYLVSSNVNGNTITLHSATSYPNDVTIGLFGMQIF